MTALTPEKDQQRDHEKEARVMLAAEVLYASTPDWATFYRQMLGIKGVVRRNYPSREEMAEFKQTPTYLEIHCMLTRLRKKGPAAEPVQDPLQVITVRIPKSLHDALQNEAFDHHTSMNKLCILEAVAVHRRGDGAAADAG